jgi:CxxC motif-containing protein (DUF1111 family)
MRAAKLGSRRRGLWAGLVLALVGAGASPAPVEGGDAVNGRRLFLHEWKANDRLSPNGDGLGPAFNARSCVACHGQVESGGAGPKDTNVDMISVSAGSRTKLALGEQDWLARLHPAFRDSNAFVLHRHDTTPGYDAWRETLLSNGLNRQDGTSSVQWGEFLVIHSRRNPPLLFGAGLIDAIPEAYFPIVPRRPAGFPEIKGHASRLKGGKAGRFGWKAQVADLNEFTLAACAGELGLEVPGHHQGIDPLDPNHKASGLDLTAAQCADLVAFLSALPAPILDRSARARQGLEAEAGRRYFDQIGCAACHSPDVGPARGIYSDLLLHDMGQRLSDGAQYYGEPSSETSSDGTIAARAQEWRTPPLWGLRDTGPYLHDGRAGTIEQAIALHDGEAQATVRRFARLKKTERASVLRFLSSLAVPTSEAAAPPRRRRS